MLTDEEITLRITHLEKENKLDEIAKLFKELKGKEQIEAIGKALGTQSSLALIKDFLQWNPEEQWKISSLLVGLSHQVFVEVLVSASKEHIQVLQHEALRESLQHHLTLFSHEMHAEVQKRSDEIEEFSALLKKNAIAEAEALLPKIERSTRGMLILIDRALSVAWNSRRPDVVEELSHSKETVLRMDSEYLGERGLIEIAEHFFGVHSKEPLHDTDPALEALTKFDIWYLKDYFSLGLLPSLQSEAEANIDSLLLSSEEKESRREELLKEAAASLSKAGLTSVSDFKAKRIFSKEALEQALTKR